MFLRNTKFDKKKFVFLTLLVVVGFAVLLFPKEARAAGAIGDAVAQVVGSIIGMFIFLLGKLVTVVVRLLVIVAQYNDFINSPAVSKGWIIIRDICNMFFIVILLIIAFCTVLRIERYSYKRLLGQLVMAAVLVNFSKLICGFLIDFSQIITLTFVNAFKDAAEGNFVQMLGLTQILQLSKDISNISTMEVIGSYILGLIMTIVALVVVTIITLIFLFRIIVLWFLVLLSPLVFLANVLPRGQSYAGQWWEKFTNQLIVGPALAFMLWLSLAVVQDKSGDLSTTMVDMNGEGGQKMTEALSAGASEIGKPQYMLNFIIGIAMLMGSLMIAQQLGVAGSQLAGKAMSGLQGAAAGAAKMPFQKMAPYARAGWGAAKGAAAGGVKALGMGLLKGAERIPKVGKAFERAEMIPQKLRDIKAGVKNWMVKDKPDVIGRINAEDELKKATARFDVADANLNKKPLDPEAQKERDEAKNRLNEANNNVTKVGKASIMDHAKFAFRENFDKTGYSDRAVLEASESKKMQETMERYTAQAKGSEELKAIFEKTTSATEKGSAAVLLAQRGAFKEYSPENINKIQGALTSLGPTMKTKFADFIKKTSDPRLVTEVFYNDFTKGIQDAKRMLDDAKEGKIDLGQFIIGMKDTQNTAFETAMGGGKAVGDHLRQNLDTKQLSETRTVLEQTNEGKARLDNYYGSTDTSSFSDADLRKYIVASGRADNIAPAKLPDFLKDNKNLVREYVSGKALEDTEMCKALMVNVAKGNWTKADVAAITKDIDKKQALKTGLKPAIASFNTDSNVAVRTGAAAEKAREIYIETAEGEGFDNVTAGLSDAEKKAYLGNFVDRVVTGKVKIDNLSKLDTKDNDTQLIMGRNLSAVQLQRLAAYGSEVVKNIGDALKNSTDPNDVAIHTKLKKTEFGKTMFS